MMEGQDDAAVVRARTESDAAAAESNKRKTVVSPITTSEDDKTPLEVMDNRNLQVYVSDPEKHGDGYDAYVSYQVLTKTTMTEFQSTEFFVRRRYQDFVWLRGKLFHEFTTCIIPPLPSKNIAKHLDRFSPEFLEKRRFYLEKFLRRVASHPKLCTSKDFHTFLEAKKWALDTAKKEKAEFFENVKESFTKRVASFKLKNPDEQYVLQRENIAILAERLSDLEKFGTKLRKHQADFASDLSELGPSFTMLANSETELRDVCTQAGQLIEKLSGIATTWGNATEFKYNDPLHEYVLFADAVTDLLDKRDVSEYHHETAQLSLQKKEAERSQTENGEVKSMFSSKNPEVLKQEKLDKLALQIAEGERTLREKEQEMQEMNASAQLEIDSWHQRKVKDVKTVLLNFSNSHIEFLSESLKIYEDLLPLFESIQD